EEAVHTYTTIIDAIDDGRLGKWNTEAAPEIAIHYWHMHPNATMRDLMLQMGADESSHRDVNHTFSSHEGTREGSLVSENPR
ncbi:alternative oxidase, partial [Baffinella frigidus]